MAKAKANIEIAIDKMYAFSSRGAVFISLFMMYCRIRIVIPDMASTADIGEKESGYIKNRLAVMNIMPSIITRCCFRSFFNIFSSFVLLGFLFIFIAC